MKTWHYILIAVVVVIIIAMLLFKKEVAALFAKTTEENTKPSTQAQPPAPLDYSKWLYKGVQDAKPEVRKLQELLGVSVDGIFGEETEAALIARKGVVQTTLTNYGLIADKPRGADGTWEEQTGTSFLESVSSMFNNGVNGAFNWITAT